ncbi:MAG: hypothetical protein AAF802_08745 [Planctomycetota bacterium]
MSGVIAGYMKDKGTGIGGGFTIQAVPYLKEIGLTPANGKFVIHGPKSKVKTWIAEHGNLKITTHQDFSEFNVTIGQLTSSNAGKIYLEEFFKGFVPSGGAIARVMTLFKRNNWAVIFRIGPISSKVPHGTFPANTVLSEVVSRGKGLKLATASSSAEAAVDAVDAATTAATLFS